MLNFRRVEPELTAAAAAAADESDADDGGADDDDDVRRCHFVQYRSH